MLESTVITSRELIELRSSYHTTAKRINEELKNFQKMKENNPNKVDDINSITIPLRLELASVQGKIECITNMLMIKFKME